LFEHQALKEVAIVKSIQTSAAVTAIGKNANPTGNKTSSARCDPCN